MKRTVLVLVAALVVIAAPLYAGNGDLIVGGKLGAGGSTTPTRSLDLRGDVSGLSFEVGAGSPNAGAIRFGDSTGWKLHFGRSRESNGGALNSGYAGVLMTVHDNGNVGIGYTDPSWARLYVNGYLYVAGQTYSNGGYFLSDIKYKKNIQTVDSSLNKILNLNGVSYEWKVDEYKDKGFPKGRHYGVVAQEIEKVLPETVWTTPDGAKVVAYAEIVPVLIEAIKEQQKQIEELKRLVKAPGH